MNSISENAISIIKDYEGYIDFISQKKRYSLYQLSYIRWTIEEILRLIKKWDNIPPLIIIEGFQEIVQNYSTANFKTNYIFSIMSDASQDIIDLLIST